MSASAAADDAQLAKRAAGGDDRAYAELVRRHQEPLYRLLRRYTGHPDEAYDATQEAFVAAWSALARYDAARPFGAWLRTIAINKARDRRRRGAVRRLLFGTRSFEESGAADRAASGQAADDALIERERAAALDRALAQLPDNLRAPLLLTAFDGYSHAEAGDILGVSPKTVEMCVYRARRKLAATFGES